jgi:hypothetical protein
MLIPSKSDARSTMNAIIYLVGLVVIVLAIVNLVA